MLIYRSPNIMYYPNLVLQYYYKQNCLARCCIFSYNNLYNFISCTSAEKCYSFHIISKHANCQLQHQIANMITG